MEDYHMHTNKVEIKMVKTEDALINTMSMLLKMHNLEDIEISDICKEAQIDRAVFYAYFTNKYDLLNYCPEYLNPENINKSNACKQ